MGFFEDLFDAISEGLKGMNEEMQNAEREAERWNVNSICNELKHCSSSNVSKMTGYGNVLKRKCRGMSTTDLKRLFSSEYASRNARACSCIKSVLEERGIYM